MFISKIPSERLTNNQESSLILRDGQIVQGKINKIYPNNQAEVQIGSHRLVAEIKAPLEVGERYIFSVGSRNDSVIQLQVIGNQISGVKSDNIVSLLAQLQIKINDTSIQFAQSLINDRIPFSKRDLIQALNLLESLGSSREIQSLLKQMIAQKLPLEENILRALLAVNRQNLSESLTNVLQDLHSLRPSQTVTNLQSLIGNLVHSSHAEQLASLPKEQVQQLLSSLQLLRYLPTANEQEIELYTNRILQDVNSRNQTPFMLLNDLYSQIQRLSQEGNILHLIKHYQSISQGASQLLQQFQLSESTQLTTEQFNLLKNSITTNLLPLLSPNEQQVVNSLLHSNNQTNLQQLQTLLQSFQSQQFFSLLIDSLMVNDEATKGNELLQQKFLLHVQQLLQTLGTNNEAIVKQLPPQFENTAFQLSQVQQTIKSLLLQVLSEERVTTENFQQLVHYINGLQLQTREENNLFQAYLQLPGAKLGLPDDLFIQFESRKTKDDQIDTEFCRILFFLNLHHLKETIIDMNIQKRVISLTIYNEFSERLPRQSESLRGMLNQGLERLDYRLSNIRFKPIQNELTNQPVKGDLENVHYTKREGFDFLV